MKGFLSPNTSFPFQPGYWSPAEFCLILIPLCLGHSRLFWEVGRDCGPGRAQEGEPWPTSFSSHLENRVNKNPHTEPPQGWHGTANMTLVCSPAEPLSFGHRVHYVLSSPNKMSLSHLTRVRNPGKALPRELLGLLGFFFSFLVPSVCFCHILNLTHAHVMWHMCPNHRTQASLPWVPTAPHLCG